LPVAAPRWPYLLWDYDGTVVDSVPSIIAAHHVATERVLGIRLDEASIRERIGEPAHKRIAALVSERADEVYAIFSEVIGSLEPEATPVFDGVSDMLIELADAGVLSALVTSRPRGLVLPSLAHLGIRNFFSTVVGLEDTEEHKPNGEPILHAVAALGAAITESVYIGDAVVDVQAAHSAGTESIAVTWGAGSLSALEAEGPTTIASSPTELAAILRVRSEAVA
jgi:pyrophosphatase PpaX